MLGMKTTKERTGSGKLETYIGDGTSFEGTIISKDNLTIYGSVKGMIECQGRVIIGDSGNVEADILANDVVISGKILGNVTAKGKLEMSATGVVRGDIKASRLVMEDGSRFDGRCEMLLEGKPAAMEKVTPALAPKEKPKLPSASHN